MSVQWFRTQHPDPVVLRPDGPTADPEIWQTVLVGTVAFMLVFFALLLYRYGLERMRGQVEALRYQAALTSSNSEEALL
jgi:heme exporter protein C